MYTPWGNADHQERVSKDGQTVFFWVSTPSHGGLGMPTLTAEKLLSPEARQAGQQSGPMLWYEEDCAWCIPAWELGADYFDFFFKYMHEPNPAQYLIDSLKFWNPVYAVKHGLITDDDEGRRFYHGRCLGQYKEDPHYHRHETTGAWTCSNCGAQL